MKPGETAYGKGSFQRTYGETFRSNFDEINWRKSAEVIIRCTKCENHVSYTTRPRMLHPEVVLVQYADCSKCKPYDDMMALQLREQTHFNADGQVISQDDIDTYFYAHLHELYPNTNQTP